MAKRAIILLLDSVGIGYSIDAKEYGDEGANTLGHIIEKYPDIKIPNLRKLGIINTLEMSCGNSFSLEKEKEPKSIYGYAKEVSKGKDTISGHWELMGCEVDFNWGYFENKENSFPDDLLNTLIAKANLTGYLGNCHASGTEIIEKYGEEHIKTNKPIFYTSADSVFQIAANEESFGLENLYKLCEIAREELYSLNIGRIIARPFIGTNPSNFARTGNRKDYSIAPNKPILFNKMQEKGGKVIAVGKVADIFANTAIDVSRKVSSLENLYNETIKAINEFQEYAIIFTNFVDFDSEYGHRRDVKGYKEALEYFDSRLPEILNILQEEDLLVIIADHGNDPTFKGSNHTREHIPIIFTGKNIISKNIGKRESFKDVASSIASYLDIDFKVGKSFL